MVCWRPDAITREIQLADKYVMTREVGRLSGTDQVFQSFTSGHGTRRNMFRSDEFWRIEQVYTKRPPGRIAPFDPVK